MGSKLSISRAWDETREIFRRDGGLLVSVALALIVFPEVVVGIVAPPESGGAAAFPDTAVQMLRLAAALVAFAGQLAIIRLALGPSTTVGAAIAHGARRFPAAFGAVFLLILALTLIMVPTGMIFAIAFGTDLTQLRTQPGGASFFMILIVLAVLALSVRFALLSPVASAEDINPFAVIKRSWQLSGRHYWRLLAVVLLLLVAAIVLLLSAGIVGGILARLFSSGMEPFSVGALIVALFAAAAQGAFSLLAALMLARIYAQAAGRDAAPSVPISGT